MRRGIELLGALALVAIIIASLAAPGAAQDVTPEAEAEAAVGAEVTAQETPAAETDATGGDDTATTATDADAGGTTRTGVTAAPATGTGWTAGSSLAPALAIAGAIGLAALAVAVRRRSVRRA